jgi:hypothetical protein
VSGEERSTQTISELRGTGDVLRMPGGSRMQSLEKFEVSLAPQSVGCEMERSRRAGSRSDEDAERFVSDYEQDGFVIVKRFFAKSVMERVDQEAQQLWADPERRVSPSNLRCRYRAHHETGEGLFECFDPVIDIGPELARIATDECLLELLSWLYRQPAHLFKDKLIFKPAGARGYPLHQDYIAWPGFPRSFLTVLVPLDAATEENGCTVVYAGGHRQGLLTPADGQFHVVPRECVSEARRVPLALEPGDIAIFAGLTPHESEPNRTALSRRQLYLSYNAHSDGGEQRFAHYRQFHRWLREKYPRPDKEAWYFA